MLDLLCILLIGMFASGSKRRSIIPRTQSVIIAIKAVGKAPTKMIEAPSVALVPRIIISPKPPAPTKAPIAVIPIATTNAFRIPP